MIKIPSLYKWLKDNNKWNYAEHENWELPPLEAVGEYIRKYPNWLDVPEENVIDID